MVAGVRVQHQGTFNMDETTNRWKPFISDQYVITRKPGFDWEGHIHMLPCVPVRVHDAYMGGEGILHASLLGLFSLVAIRGPGDLAKGKLMRFFAESAWYPSALLPSQGVHWEALDDHSAFGTFTDDEMQVTLLFTFNEQGLIDSVRAKARGRRVGNRIVPTPWHGRYGNYQERDGMTVPFAGEVAWLFPEGSKPYWRGNITGIAYEFA